MDDSPAIAAEIVVVVRKVRADRGEGLAGGAGVHVTRRIRVAPRSGSSRLPLARCDTCRRPNHGGRRGSATAPIDVCRSVDSPLVACRSARRRSRSQNLLHASRSLPFAAASNTRNLTLSRSLALQTNVRSRVPFPSRRIPEKERRGGRVDLNAARGQQIPTAVSGRLMRSGRRASRAGGSVREGATSCHESGQRVAVEEPVGLPAEGREKVLAAASSFGRSEV
jgi:hypothetical protein